MAAPMNHTFRTGIFCGLKRGRRIFEKLSFNFARELRQVLPIDGQERPRTGLKHGLCGSNEPVQPELT
jgi:hypothetical protein